jgi:hypothetical protein
MNDKAHDHEADWSDFEGTYYKLKSDMEKLLPSQETGSMLVVPTSEASSSLDGTCSDTNQSVSQSQGFLPSIPLPTFDGKYENWAKFENIFKVMVNNHTDVTCTEKYNYLQWHLRIKHLSWFRDFLL